jgi:tRNA pseudouridine38-40 synthase
MEHSNAILQDASNKIDDAARSAPAPDPSQSNGAASGQNEKKSDDRRDERKRKGNWQNSSMHHGSRGGRNDNKRHKKGDMGRGEYLYVNHACSYLFA